MSFPKGLPVPKELDFSKRNITLLLYNVGPANALVPPELRPRLSVVCREFPETPGICSVKSWTKGTSKIDIHLPNVAMNARQCSETAKKLDELIETEYKKLVNELAINQDQIVVENLREAVRQSEKVSHPPRRQTSFPAKSFHQVSAYQDRSSAVNSLPTCL